MYFSDVGDVTVSHHKIEEFKSYVTLFANGKLAITFLV